MYKIFQDAYHVGCASFPYHGIENVRVSLMCAFLSILITVKEDTDCRSLENRSRIRWNDT